MSDDFKGRHFRGEVILWAVRWYCRYGVSYRELAEMLAERGVEVDHTTIHRWVQAYAPGMERRLRRNWKRPGLRRTWKVDETYVRVRGRGTSLYQAVTDDGRTIDFYLSRIRNVKAAKRFLGKALRPFKNWERPVTINTDKAGCYGQAIREPKREGKMAADTRHRQVKHLNNRVEAEHGKLKRVIRPTMGFKTMKIAYATLKGFEVMRALKKGQAALRQYQDGIAGKVRLVERAFGLGSSGMAGTAHRLRQQMHEAVA